MYDGGASGHRHIHVHVRIVVLLRWGQLERHDEGMFQLRLTTARRDGAQPFMDGVVDGVVFGWKTFSA